MVVNSDAKKFDFIVVLYVLHAQNEFFDLFLWSD